jgi:hypothetical protein
MHAVETKQRRTKKRDFQVATAEKNQQAGFVIIDFSRYGAIV